MELLNAIRKLEKEGWKRFSNNRAPNTKKNLKKYDFCTYGILLFYRLKNQG
ncbi:hypothetical protein KKC91_11125 [bacterium]|nr:hypothetical protein [bacterium]